MLDGSEIDLTSTNRGTTYFMAPNPPWGVIIDYRVAPEAIVDVLLDYEQFGRISSVYKDYGYLEPLADGTGGGQKLVGAEVQCGGHAGHLIPSGW